MTRAGLRAWKCRMGVHRGATDCPDCGRIILRLTADAFDIAMAHLPVGASLRCIHGFGIIRRTS